MRIITPHGGGGTTNEHKIGLLVGKYKVKISIGIPRHSLENNIKMNPKDIRREVTDWIKLT